MLRRAEKLRRLPSKPETLAKKVIANNPWSAGESLAGLLTQNWGRVATCREIRQLSELEFFQKWCDEHYLAPLDVAKTLNHYLG